jgi:hypothetical protein
VVTSISTDEALEYAAESSITEPRHRLSFKNRDKRQDSSLRQTKRDDGADGVEIDDKDDGKTSSKSTEKSTSTLITSSSSCLSTSLESTAAAVTLCNKPRSKPNGSPNTHIFQTSSVAATTTSISATPNLAGSSKPSATTTAVG